MECFSGFIESCLNIFSNTAMSFLLRYWYPSLASLDRMHLGAERRLFFSGGARQLFADKRAWLARGQSEPYSFLSDVQRLTPSSRIIYFN